jgi:hypothetical protein
MATTNQVKTVAVENFLGSLEGLTKSEAYANLRLDARLYKWNAATVKAINAGIAKHFSH